jgi:poly [ADP-ribose] polymerase 10/14/15
MPSNTRYVEMSEPIYDNISEKIYKSYPNACICWIEENINPDLRKKYEDKRESIRHLIHENDILEQEMFHGTTINGVSSILNNGFDPSYNKTSAYGIGTYFARDAKYSMNYMKPCKDGISYMFIADVIQGRTMIGKLNKIIDTSMYESYVDNISNPSILVTPFSDGAFPKYIIAFYKEAK